MTSTPLTADQIGMLQKLLGVRLRNSILLEHSVQRVIETAGDLVADEMLEVIWRRVKVFQTLTHLGTIEVELPFDFDPNAYYRQKRNRLEARGGFNRGFAVSFAKPLPARTKFRLKVHEVVATNGATNTEIKEALGDNHTFGNTEICGVLAALMDAQPNGEEGNLLVDATNVAYLKEYSFDAAVAEVYRGFRGHNDCRWVVSASSGRIGNLGDCVQPLGSRIFSPVN